MPRLTMSALTVMLILVLAAVAPQQAFGPPSPQAGQASTLQPVQIPLDLFKVPEGFEVTLVGGHAAAAQPDQHRHRSRRPHLGGRRRSLPLASRPPARRRSHRRRCRTPTATARPTATHTFVQEPALIAPLGVAVIDNKIVVVAAARPHRLHGRRSQPALRSGGGQARGAADRLPGHQSRPLAALGDGRPGRQVDVQLRQHRRDVHRQVGQDVPHLRLLPSRPGRPVQVPERPRRLCRQAERRRARVRRRIHRADESGRHQRGDHRLQLSQQLRAVGHLARRRLPERQRRSAGVPRELGDGVRQLRLLVERRPADVAGGSPARPVDSGRGVAPGRSGHDAGRRRLRRRIADRQCLLRERRARPVLGRDVLRGRRRPQRGVLLPAGAPGRGFRARPEDLPDLEREAAVRRVGLRDGQRRRHQARSRRCSGRRTSPSVPTARCMSATGSTRGSAGTRIWTTRCPARFTGSRRRASSRRCRRSTPRRSTVRSPRCGRPRSTSARSASKG